MPIRPRAHVAAALLTAAVASFAPGAGTAPAAAAEPLSVGIHAQLRTLPAAQLSARIKTLREAGLDYSREDFTWNTIEPKPGKFCWDHYDRLVEAAARSGLRIVAIADGPPTWATSGWTEAPTEGAELQAYARFVRKLVERYGSRGSFWAEHKDVPKLPITYFDIWNEPYFNQFWSRNFPDPGGYARMFRAAVAEARPADPNAKFMLEADMNNFGPGGGQPFLDRMFDAVPDLASYADVVSLHPYASFGRGPAFCTPGANRMVRRFQVCRVEDIRRILDAHGGSRLPLWMTEIGWSTAPNASDTVGETEQAAYVRDLFSLLRGRWKNLFQGVIWYSYTSPERDPRKRTDFFGLVHPDGRPKPGWGALVEEAARHPVSVPDAGDTACAPSGKSGKARRPRLSRRLVLSPRRNRIRVGLRAFGPVRYRMVVRRGRRVVARGIAGRLCRGRRTLTLALGRRLRPGRYVVRVNLRWSDGRRPYRRPFRVTV